MDVKEILGNFNHGFTLLVIFPAIIGIGLYLTLKLRCIQLSHLKESFQLLTHKTKRNKTGISQFGTISAVLAGNLGTGNISGMAVAIATGGPGALVWMWIMAFFGAAIQYASCILGITYRHKSGDSEYAGGPMYYLRDGLGYKKLAVLFSAFTIFGAVTVGNFAQINSIMLPLHSMGFNPLYTSLFIAVFVALVIFGGIKRLAHFASLIVPFKALVYLTTACIIIGFNYDRVLGAFALMFEYAFDYSSFVGGAMGFGMLKAITTGFDRGLFATDAGTGIVPILQANAPSNNSVEDGIAILIAPFTVMIVCTATGLVLILTDAWQMAGLQSTNMVTYAFTKGLGTPLGGYIVILSLVLFAYTTILAWSYCGEKALEFLIGPQKKNWFRYFFILCVPVGALVHVDLIWILADIAITLMLMINLIGIAGLSKHVIEATRKYKTSRHGHDKKPDARVNFVED